MKASQKMEMDINGLATTQVIIIVPMGCKIILAANVQSITATTAVTKMGSQIVDDAKGTTAWDV